MNGRALLPALLLSIALPLHFSGCGGDDGDRVRVYAAASLTDVFEEVAEAFEDANESVDVDLNFAGSSSLALQIAEGAPADVFASANEKQMQVVIDAGDAEGARVFATNTLAIAVPAGSNTVRSLADLTKPGVRLVLAAEDVPAGDFAREVLRKAGEGGDYGENFAEDALANVVSFESDVRAVIVKVQLGEADAGMAYTTDVAVAGDDVEAIAIPPALNVTARYPIALVEGGSNPEGGEAFIDFVLSAEGQAILARHGFGPAQ